MQALAARRGLKLVSVSQIPDLAGYLTVLEKKGILITKVFDVGAHVGSWSTSLAQQLHHRTKFYLFEGNLSHYEELIATGHAVYPVLLGEENGEVMFFSTGGTGDSVFIENTHHYRGVIGRRLQSRRLDDVVREFDLPTPDLLKIDTQGSELAILRGATQTLAEVSLVYLEIPILRYNLGAPSFDQYISTLSTLGFIPIGVFEIHIARGALAQIDVLFASTRAFKVAFGEDSLDFAAQLAMLHDS